MSMCRVKMWTGGVRFLLGANSSLFLQTGGFKIPGAIVPARDGSRGITEDTASSSSDCDTVDQAMLLGSEKGGEGKGKEQFLMREIKQTDKEQEGKRQRIISGMEKVFSGKEMNPNGISWDMELTWTRGQTGEVERVTVKTHVTHKKCTTDKMDPSSTDHYSYTVYPLYTTDMKHTHGTDIYWFLCPRTNVWEEWKVIEADNLPYEGGGQEVGENSKDDRAISFTFTRTAKDPDTGEMYQLKSKWTRSSCNQASQEVGGNYTDNDQDIIPHRQ